MRKTLRVVVSDRNGVVAAVTTLQPKTLVVDVQPFVAPWGSSAEATMSAAVELCGYIADSMPCIRTLVFASNARSVGRRQRWQEGLQVMFVGGANKPWRTTCLARAPRPVVVLGDQVLTDGLLAVRLHGQFLHWRPGGRPPLWPRLQEAIGELVAKFVFSPMYSCCSTRD
jgi:hypothetical protein